MHTNDEHVAVDVEIPGRLLAEMDAYGARRGYATPDAVVRRALDRQSG
jgi:hypothetical protein